MPGLKEYLKENEIEDSDFIFNYYKNFRLISKLYFEISSKAGVSTLGHGNYSPNVLILTINEDLKIRSFLRNVYKKLNKNFYACYITYTKKIGGKQYKELNKKILKKELNILNPNVCFEILPRELDLNKFGINPNIIFLPLNKMNKFIEIKDNKELDDKKELSKLKKEIWKPIKETLRYLI